MEIIGSRTDGDCCDDLYSSEISESDENGEILVFLKLNEFIINI